MNTLNKSIFIVLSGLFLLSISGCVPEVGSDKWCKEMEEKSKADWTTNDATDYAKHCILK